MMKILMIDTVEIDFNGITDCMYQYLQAMEREDMQIDIVAVKPSNTAYEQRFRELGCRVFHIDCRSRNPLKYVQQLSKLVRKNKYDAVHVHGNSATMTFDLLGAKLGGCKVRIAHGHNTSCTHAAEDKILRPVFYRLTTERFACGDAAGQWLYRGRTFTVIPNGRDLKRLTYRQELRERLRRELGLGDALTVGHVGGFTEVKNQSFAVKVFANIQKQNPEAKLVLMGDGELLGAVKKQAEESGIADCVIFTGNVSNIPELLNAMDVMMLPSIHEGLPLVVMEWQAAGLPCFLSDNVTRECGLCDLVHYLPLKAGAEKWASEIMALEIPERNEAGRKGQQALKNAGYDIEENARSLKQKYKKMIAKGNSYGK